MEPTDQKPEDQLAPGTSVGLVKDPNKPVGEASTEEKELQSGDHAGCHFISKGRVYKTADGKLVGENGDQPAVLFAARAGLKFDEWQLEGFENAAEFFTKINHIAE